MQGSGSAPKLQVAEIDEDHWIYSNWASRSKYVSRKEVIKATRKRRHTRFIFIGIDIFI